MYNKEHSGEHKVMKIVKDINKLIITKVVEIFLVVGFVFLASYLWRSKNAQEFFSSIASFSNLYYTNFMIENPIDYSMFPMRDEDAMQNLKPCTVKVMNETYTSENYALILKIDKTSTMDYHYIHIGINDKVYALNDLGQVEETENYVFTLAKDTIVGNTKNYEIRVWLNTLAGNEMQGKNLIMHFDLINETTQV